MWAALVGPLLELIKWLLGSVVSEAKAPVPGLVITPSPGDRAHDSSVRNAVGSFPGIGSLGLALFISTGLFGCNGLFEQRAIVARPAIPVVLAEDLTDVLVLVKLDDTHYTQAYINLYAGEVVCSDTLDYPAELINRNGKRIATAQGIKPVDK